jgi:hypothetical protein
MSRGMTLGLYFHNVHGRPLTADRHTWCCNKKKSTEMVTRVENVDPTFGTHAAKKRDHFPATVFKMSRMKTTRYPRTVPFWGPENGHVFGTERVQNRAPDIDVPISSGTEVHGPGGDVGLEPAC